MKGAAGERRFPRGSSLWLSRSSSLNEGRRWRAALQDNAATPPVPFEPASMKGAAGERRFYGADAANLAAQWPQ